MAGSAAGKTPTAGTRHRQTSKGYHAVLLVVVDRFGARRSRRSSLDIEDSTRSLASNGTGAGMLPPRMAISVGNQPISLPWRQSSSSPNEAVPRERDPRWCAPSRRLWKSSALRARNNRAKGPEVELIRLPDQSGFEGCCSTRKRLFLSDRVPLVEHGWVRHFLRCFSISRRASP